MSSNSDTRPEIVICLGSSCFSRGNKQSVKLLEEYLRNNHLREKVFFHGGHCFGRCVEGPILQVEDQVLEHFNPGNLKETLDGILSARKILK
jgi:NADH:ubiquinone oxidoreductase subunit E